MCICVCFIKSSLGTGAMAQQLRTVAAFGEVPGFGSHIAVYIICNPSVRGSMSSPSLWECFPYMVHLHSAGKTHMHKVTMTFFFFKKK